MTIAFNIMNLINKDRYQRVRRRSRLWYERVVSADTTMGGAALLRSSDAQPWLAYDTFIFPIRNTQDGQRGTASTTLEN